MEMGDLKKKDKLEDVGSGSGSGSVKKVAAGDEKLATGIILAACLLYYCYTIRGRLLAAIKATAMDFLFEIFKAIAILMATLLILVLIFLGQKTYHPALPKEKDEHVKAPHDVGEQKPIPDHDKPIKAADAGKQKPIEAAAGGGQKRQSTPYDINFRVFCNLTMLIFFCMNYPRLIDIGKELFIALAMATIIAIVVFMVLMIIHISAAGDDDMKADQDHHVQLTLVVRDDDDNEIHNDQDQKIIGHIIHEDHKAEDRHDDDDQVQQVIGGGVEQAHDHYTTTTKQDDKAPAPAPVGLRDEEKPQTQRKRKKRHYKTEAFLEGVLQGTNTIIDILTGQAVFSLFNR